jgi:alpha-2-macroglobulin
VLALMSPNSGTLQAAFYRRQSHYIYTDLSIDGLLEAVAKLGRAMPPELGGGGGGGGGGGSPRTNFDTTPLWLPHLVTDEDGRATVEVKLPDNLTTWQLDARALTMDMQVAQTTTEVVASLPLMVRPVTPRFFVAGDRLELAAIINNNTDKDQPVEATLEAKGVRLVGSGTQKLSVQAGGRVRVAWSVVVDNVPGADLTFYAAGRNGVQDSAKPALRTGPGDTVPIYEYTTPDFGASTGGVLRSVGSRTEVISLPRRLNTGQGDLIVRLDPSLAAALPGSFTYLRQYPYLCVEQTTSRFLPNVATFKALADLGLNNPGLEQGLRKALGDALTKLAGGRNKDGGWGWFDGMESHPLTTAYVALGLLEARHAGFDIAPLKGTDIDQALALIRATMSVSPIALENWQLNRQAFFLYVLARADQGKLEDYTALFAVRQRLSYAARAYLLMAYHERFPNDSAVTTLVSDLVSAAKISATGAYWEEESDDWWNWGTDIRTTALALTALIRTAPDSPLLPNIVRYLMIARQGDHWPTTQETVWSITALVEWMTLTKELQGKYSYTVNFNRKSLVKGAITPENISDETTLHVAVKDLLANDINRLVVARGEGNGVLYYTAQFNLKLPAAEAKPVSRGITLKREYFVGEDVMSIVTPDTPVRVGDTITVRLTINLAQDMHFFAVEDTFPSGTEPVNDALRTTSLAAEGERFGRFGSRWSYWYWGWWAFRHSELTDAQARLYSDFLRRGTYVYTYQVRATLPGEFQLMPTYAYTFYDPDFFGRSDGGMLRILTPSGEK